MGLNSIKDSALYVVQPLPMVDLFALAVLNNISLEGLSPARAAERAYEVAAAALKVRAKWHEKLKVEV